MNRIDPSGQASACPVGDWDCNTVNRIASLKQAFLDSAARHNRISTMDTNGFAALIASVIASEQHIGSRVNSPRQIGQQLLQVGENLAAGMGCVVSGHSIKAALERNDYRQAARYIFNEDVSQAQYATVGIGNVSLETAMNLWNGKAISSVGDSTPIKVDLKITSYNWSGTPQTSYIPSPFPKPLEGYNPTELGMYQALAEQLLDDRQNIEYVAANLDAGAQRAISIGQLKPSAFNSATWHLKGLQTDTEIRSAWAPCPAGPCLILEEIPNALAIWGLTSTWNINTEVQYAYWKAQSP